MNAWEIYRAFAEPREVSQRATYVSIACDTFFTDPSGNAFVPTTDSED
jgi:hypothetical protein